MTHWAEDYIGKPWANGACGPDAFDCHGLVRAVYRERAGVALPVVDADALKPIQVLRAMRDYDYSAWAQIDAPAQEMDVVEMSLARRPHHVGVWIEIDGGGVLTAVEGAGVIFQTRRSLQLHGWNIVACYRHRTRIAEAAA